MGIARVAFDESGNTGQDLLNKEQPIFVLASTYLGDDVARDLVSKTIGKDTNEVHYTRLKKHHDGQNKILNLISSAQLSGKNIKLAIYHKRFMIMAKIVDILVEQLAHEEGFDLYERGANIALSNMLFMVLPVFVPPALVDEFYSKFVGMIRNKNPESVMEFYRSIDVLATNCRNGKLNDILALLKATERVAYDVITFDGMPSLDPAIPAFVDLAALWGGELNQEFEIIHDNSKPLIQAEDILRLLIRKDIEPMVVGYDRRMRTFPLSANALTFVDSLTVPQVQIADIFAGSCADWARGKLNPSLRTVYWKRLDESFLKKYVGAFVWPDTAVTPKDLATDNGEITDPFQHLMKIFRKPDIS